MFCDNQHPCRLVYLHHVCCFMFVASPQECTWNFAEMRPSVGEMLLELDAARDHAFRGIGSTLHMHNKVRISLCTAVMRRWPNACTAIIFNCCILWEYRFQVTLNVVGFGEDNDALSWLSFYARPALANGLLFLASGGSAGLRATRHGTAAGPHMPSMRSLLPAATQGEALPPCAAVDKDNAELMTTWHASYAKNSSHELASYVADNVWEWKEEDGPQILCNIDGDNFVTRMFPQAVARVYVERCFDMGYCIQASSACCWGSTGRLCYMRTVFDLLGGYDVAGTQPMGYQDIDMRDRVRSNAAWAASSTATIACPTGGFPKNRTITLGVSEIGGALPNDTRVREADRGSQKVLHTGTSVADRGTWGRMNKANAKLMKDRLEAGQLIRN